MASGMAQATADLYKDFDPSRETWEEFGRRAVQAERTLTSLGFGVDVRAAERHMRKSAVIKEMMGMGPSQQISHLKQAYASVLLDPTTDTSGLRKPILEELLTQRGLRVDEATVESLVSGTSSSAPGSEAGGAASPAPAPQMPEEKSPDPPPGLQGASLGGSAALAEAFSKAMKAQTAALAAALKDRPKQSTIRINPHVEYTVLGDEDNDVEQFFERFDEICALANDGTGMAEGIFAHIKSRLLRFVETDYEKQTRVLLDYQQCQCGKKAALIFQPVWETLLYEMDRVGLGRSPRELLLHYLHCVGTVRDIMEDLRPWPHGEGGVVNRRVQTWEEAHIVLSELEGLRASARALTSQYRIDETPRRQRHASHSVIPNGTDDISKKISFRLRDRGD